MGVEIARAWSERLIKDAVIGEARIRWRRIFPRRCLLCVMTLWRTWKGIEAIDLSLERDKRAILILD